MITSFRVKRFKAVQDSGEIRLGSLTAFIGNNGSGKSSVIDAMQTYQQVIMHGLDQAMLRWRGLEHIHNPPIQFTGGQNRNERKKIQPIEFSLKEQLRVKGTFRTEMHLGLNPSGDEIYIQAEKLIVKNKVFLERNQEGVISVSGEKGRTSPIRTGLSMFGMAALASIGLPFEGEDADRIDKRESAILAFNAINWQFLNLNPWVMGDPQPQQRTTNQILLDPNGSNIAEYLIKIRRENVDVFNGIVEALQAVLPYMKDIQPALTSELERMAYLQMTEGKARIPGWLLSTGTLRILALLAVLRNPTPPPLIVIEELENGLDPRVMHMIVDEIRALVESEQSQIIITTHSPYLLNLLDLSHIVLCERDANGSPKFSRPADRPALVEWSNRFAPGDLYAAGRLSNVDAS